MNCRAIKDKYGGCYVMHELFQREYIRHMQAGGH